jgi:hypothetical protein
MVANSNYKTTHLIYFRDFSLIMFLYLTKWGSILPLCISLQYKGYGQRPLGDSIIILLNMTFHKKEKKIN